MKSSTGKPTQPEAERMARLKEIGCICCQLQFGHQPCHNFEVHHIVSGNRRLGHWYTLPLCRRHHQGRLLTGPWTSIAQGSKAFAKVHGPELDLWLKVQHILGLSDELPPSK